MKRECLGCGFTLDLPFEATKTLRCDDCDQEMTFA